MPVAAAKMVAVMMIATYSEPGTGAISFWNEWNNSSIKPALSNKYPMNRKKGMAPSTGSLMTW